MRRSRGQRKTNPSRGELKLTQRRLEHGVTQQELADATGIHFRTIQELEKGWVDNPKIRNLVNIAAALGVKDFREICEPEWLEPRKLGRYQNRPDETKPPQPVKRLRKKPGRFVSE